MSPLLLLLACNNDQGITMIPEPPVVDITSPLGAEEFRQGQGAILVQAVVSDSRDAPGDLDLTWTVGENELEAQADDLGAVFLELDPDLLQPGPQTVSLSALDSDGELGWDSVDFLVWGPLGAPLVEITDPADGSAWLPATSITFQGQASDVTTPADELVFAWESDLDGPLAGAVTADGRSVLVTSTLSLGSHLVTLTVVDGDGEIGSDSITVHVAKEEEKTKKEEEEDAEPGDLVLSELMVNPQVVEDTEGEWFELYNTAGYDIQIQGYTLRDEDYDTWVIDVPMSIPAHSYYLVCADLNPNTNGGVEGCDAWFYRSELPPPGMAFGNNGDEVILVRPDGVEIDRLVYDDAWVEDAAAVGVDPDHLDHVGNDDMGNWCPQRTVVTWGGEPGTPGFENDPC
ncbi:lamin tail domain-containing protein [Myxococcota bacterium]|nr:lamin tail domain-containing protein [Myxococcota bacterium]